jgi:MFS transporter, putative metabolite transport protein
MPLKETLAEFEESGNLPGQKASRAIVLALMGAFLDGYDLLIMGVILLSLIPQWHLSSASTGGIAASAFVGMVVGAAVFGSVADRIGRRAVFTIDMILFIAGAIACGLARNVLELMIFRFFVGVAIGMDAPTSTSIFAEYSTNRTRGRNTTLMQVFWPLGSVVASCVALILHFYGGAGAWRWMFISGLIPAIVVLLLRKDLPETPYWLKAKEERKVASEFKDSRKRRSLGSWKELMQWSWRSPLLFVVCFWFLTNIAGSSLLVYMPFVAQGSFGLSQVAAILFSAGITFLYSGLLLLLAFKVIDSSGRRPMSLAGLAVATVTALAVSVVGEHTVTMIVLFSLMAVSLLAPGPGAFWGW